MNTLCIHPMLAAFAAWTAFAGTRPYEFEWANRTADDRPVLLPLVSTDGWTCEATGATAVFTTACERVLFGDGVAHLAYKIPEGKGVIKLKPPAPVPIPVGSDTVSLWIWGNHTHYHFREVPWDDRLSISADFLDAAGKPFSVFLHKFNHWNWHLLQRRLAPHLIARVAKGGKFIGFTLRGGRELAGRWIELTSLAVYKEEFKPLSFKPRRKRGVQIFPNEPQGLNTGEGRLPFPNVETTIIPIVAEDPSIEFKFPKDPTNWDDLAVRLTCCSTLNVSSNKTASVQQQGGGWIYFAKGGGLFPAAAAKGAKIRFHRIANSLIADIEAPAGVEEVRFGCMEKPNEAVFTPIPYYTCGGNGDGVYRRPCVVSAGKGEGRLFHLASVDWTQSNASWVFPTNHPVPVASNGGVRYHPKTDGTRNPVFERFVWSFSTKFEDVLPNIPNPPSPWRAVTAERQWAVMHANNREKDKAFWRERRRRGIKHLIVNDHETCMRDQNESFTFRTRPAPGKGGDEGMRDFTRFMIDELGYMYGPYNNYTDFAPVNGYWSADRVTRLRTLDFLTAWNRCYAPKPAWINEACEEIWTELQRKFRFNTAYCDVHTCTTPWQRTDYDARVPGAGTFAATFYSFGELLDFERRVLNGPVYSEGQSQYLYCGIVDGNYAQDQRARLFEEPWLVDFDLLRLHPLCNNFGMGYPAMFYPKTYKAPSHTAWRDRFLAATVAFGHQGFFLKFDPEDEDQSYFMLLGTGRHYCKADAKEIRYADADGKLYDTSSAVDSSIYRRSQVVVRYTDGTVTAANGSTNEEMRVTVAGRNLRLAPNGYCSFAGDGTAWAVSGEVRDDGKRLDISAAPDYVYLNSYGQYSTSPFGGTDGRMYRLIEKGGTEEVFLRSGKTFDLPYAAKSVTALDEAGKEIGPAPFEVKDGTTRMTHVNGAVSYRVVKSSAPVPNDVAKASDFGFDPDDSTEILQKALDSGARKIVIDRQASPWITRPLFVRSNCEIVFERGVEVVAKKGAFLGKGDSLLTLNCAENVKISGYGATLRMHRADYAAPPYAKAEWRMSINLRSCRNVTIEGLVLVESGGDGVYVGVAGKGGPCRDIVLRDLVCDRQYRQGISVISARNLLIERCVLRNTGGTPPAAGIDFEPNHPAEELDGIVMRDCTISDNRGVGIAFYFGQLNDTSKPVSIRIENCRSSGNSQGFGLSNGRRETFVRGRVTCENCTFENERGYAVRLRRKPADSVLVDFANCRFINCQTNAQNAVEAHDMSFGDAAPGAGPTDGVSFRDCTIRQPVARDWLPRGQNALVSDIPSQITGNLTVVSPSGSTKFALDAAWRNKYFVKPVLADAPKRRAFDPALARPFDSCPGELVRLKPFRFRNGVTYRFFMSAPGEARFSGRFTKVGRPSFTPKPIVIKDVTGKTCATVNLNGTDETPFSFMAKKAGFYTMTADVGSHAFGLSATSVPIAVTPAGLDRSIYATQGTLFFRAAADAPFIVAVSGSNAAERIRAQVTDPSGNVVWDRDRISEWTAYRSGEHPAEGLWSVTFKRPTGCAFEDFSVLQQGAAPDFFLTPDKCW